MSDDDDPDALTGCADDQIWAGVSIEELRRARFRADDPDGLVLDALMFSSWAGLIHWLLEQDWAHVAFRAETGLALAKPRSAIDAMIDGACGVDVDALAEIYAAEFIRWATRDHFGTDEVTPSIQEVLDRLPKRH